MDFDLSEEQVALQEVAREFLAERWPADRMRAALDAMPFVIDEEVWREIVEMGWLGVAAPEEAGGIGGDIMTAAVLAEEAGRGLLPGPFDSALVAAIALDRSGDVALRDGLLCEVIDGKRRVTLAFEEPTGAWGPDAIAMSAKQEGDGYLLDGTKILVPDAAGSDELLVAARVGSGLGFLRVPTDAEGVALTPMNRMDAQAMSEVVFTNVGVPASALVGAPERADATVRETYDIWTLLCAADLLGTTEAALELTRRYAIERVQFGKPIGTFQAVSHRIADSLVDVEIGRSLLFAACLAVDENRDNAPALISAVKAWMSDAALTAVESALQIHGGVGFTWEYDVHLHMRRARCNAVRFGDADHHRDRIALHMDETRVPSAKQ